MKQSFDLTLLVTLEMTKRFEPGTTMEDAKLMLHDEILAHGTQVEEDFHIQYVVPDPVS